MFSQLMDFKLNLNTIRQYFKEGLFRELTDVSENPERFIRAYIVPSTGGTLITNERPTLVSDYRYPIYFVDIPKNFRHIPLQDLFTFSRIGYIYDTETFVKSQGGKEIMGYLQDEKYNRQSSLIIGIVCGLILQNDYGN